MNSLTGLNLERAKGVPKQKSVLIPLRDSNEGDLKSIAHIVPKGRQIAIRFIPFFNIFDWG
jgi:hypothetical protein